MPLLTSKAAAAPPAPKRSGVQLFVADGGMMPPSRRIQPRNSLVAPMVSATGGSVPMVADRPVLPAPPPMASEAGDRPQCCICLDDMLPHHEKTGVWCGHSFHSYCITEWRILCNKPEDHCPLRCHLADVSEAPEADGSGAPVADGSGEPVADGSGEPVADGSGEPVADGSGEPVAHAAGNADRPAGGEDADPAGPSPVLAAPEPVAAVSSEDSEAEAPADAVVPFDLSPSDIEAAAAEVSNSVV